MKDASYIYDERKRCYVPAHAPVTASPSVWWRKLKSATATLLVVAGLVAIMWFLTILLFDYVGGGPSVTMDASDPQQLGIKR